MANPASRIVTRIRENRNLQVLLVVGVALAVLNIFVEEHILPKPADGFWEMMLRLSRTMSDILLVGFLFGIVFDYSERLKLIDEFSEKLGLLTGISKAGITQFFLDSRDVLHVDEIEKSETFRVCIRGSASFFKEHSRSDNIVARLKRGMKIEIWCLEDHLDAIIKFAADCYAIGAAPDSIEIYTHTSNLMYNFLEVDNGIWIKTYWIEPKPLLSAPPAFFVSAKSDLWDKYKQDIGRIEKRRAPL